MQVAKIIRELLKMFAMVVIAIIVLFSYFRIYTHHGQEITVPDVRGMEMNQVKKMLNKQDLKFIVDDSTYKANMPPGSVIDQSPKAGSKVKEGRKVYLTINASTPPSVKMPNLKDISKRQAILILESLGLQYGQDIYMPDIAKDIVLGIKVNGRDATPGMVVLKGSSFDLVLGDGIGGTEIEVPNMVGLMLGEALAVIEAVNLMPGLIKSSGAISDSMTAFVYFQQPTADTLATIRVGEPVDLFIIQNIADTAGLSLSR